LSGTRESSEDRSAHEPEGLEADVPLAFEDAISNVDGLSDDDS